MVTKRPRIVIIGAGMAGLTAANKLYTTSHFDLAVVEGGDRIGGRISTADFSGDRIEQGATWIHGIEGSPVFKIAQETSSLTSEQPWECMDGISEDPITVAEGGFKLNPAMVEPISSLFRNLMDFIQGKPVENGEFAEYCAGENLSVGNFLRRGLEAYWALGKDDKDVKMVGNWTRKSLEQGIFAMHESIQRTFTSADDLCNLDYNTEREYVMFPGEEITIAKGYSSVIEHLASVLPAGMIQFGKKVEKIEWQQESIKSNGIQTEKNGYDSTKPVKLHFSDGSSMSADHVIVTVSLGVLKQAITQDSAMFLPPLPSSKRGAISRLGYGVVNKVFLQLDSEKQDSHDQEQSFPFLQMVFHPSDSELRNPKIPQWIRRTSFLCPIYKKSRILLSWFTGQEALHLESLSEEEIISGFSKTVANLLPSKCSCNGHSENPPELKFGKVLRTQWGTNPLFFGSYSFVAVGSSIDDMDILSEPLPTNSLNLESSSPPPPLQLLFAGEATHKTHYSTTHGAYFSGLREANRLLKHYNYMGFV